MTVDADTMKQLTAVVTALIALFKFLDYKTSVEKMRLARKAFDGVVTALASQSMAERMAGAILLRRFYDAKSEVGKPHRLLAKEAVAVAAAMLRGHVSGDLQKLLADGLAFAPTLFRADLQKTNLQNAYLGVRMVADERWWKRAMRRLRITETRVRKSATDLSYADFYRADLSNASLKSATARHAVFYQARLVNTVLKGADLRNANFFEADLKGARFSEALLEGASFLGARNIPPEIGTRLDVEGKYRDKNKFVDVDQRTAVGRAHIFISRAGALAPEQQEYVNWLERKIDRDGMIPDKLDRPDYPSFGVFAEVRRVMAGCSGAAIIASADLRIEKALFRPGTGDQKEIGNVSLATPWNHIEAAMAITLGVPVFIIRDRTLKGGVFDMKPHPGVFHAFIEDGNGSEKFDRVYAEWLADVREQHSRSDGVQRAAVS